MTEDSIETADLNARTSSAFSPFPRDAPDHDIIGHYVGFTRTMSTTRRHTVSNPTGGNAEDIGESGSTQTTMRRRRASTITRQPRVKARGMKAAKEGESETHEQTAEDEKEAKDGQKAETETKTGDKRGAEGDPVTSGTEGEAAYPKKKGRRGGPRRNEAGVVYKEGALNAVFIGID